MYDYIRRLADGLSDEDIINVFGTIAMLDNHPICEHWEKIIAGVGVEGFLGLAETLGGCTVTLPTLYQFEFVYAAMLVAQRLDDESYDEAKEKVIGGIHLEGFRELVEKIHGLTDRTDMLSGSESARTILPESP